VNGYRDIQFFYSAFNYICSLQFAHFIILILIYFALYFFLKSNKDFFQFLSKDPTSGCYVNISYF
jgi:hypothetical protein